MCATLLFGHVLNLLHRDISIMVFTLACDLRGMLTWLCKKMSLPARDLRYIITSKMLVHCTEHQYAFFYKTPVVIDPCRSNPMCKN